MAKQKTITPISDIKVVLIGKVDKNNLQETVCTYKFKGHDVNRFVFVKREKGDADTTCINKAKKELMRLHKSGALEAYSNKYIKGAATGGAGLTRKGIAILASASVIAAGALITGGIFIGKALINNPYRPTVTFDAVSEGAYFGDNPALTKISINVDKGAKVGDFIDAINVPTLEYNDFKAWTLEGSEIERDYQVYEDTTFSASFVSQKTTIYLEAGGDGYGSLTPLGVGDINDMINVVSFTVDRGTTLGEALLDEKYTPRFQPGIYRATDAESYEVKGWSLDGGTTFIDLKNPESEALLQKTLDEEKYTLLAGYDLKGSEYSDITDFKPEEWQTVVFNADGEQAATDKTLQTGQWDYYNSTTYATTTVKTLSLMVDPTKISNLKALEDKDINHTWYDNPIGDYAGFGYWYDSHKTKEKTDPSTIEFTAGGKLNLTASYEPHFIKGANYKQDPWRAVINNANLGLDNLHYIYEDDVKNNTNFPNTLVGLQRDVETTDQNGSTSNDVKIATVIGEAQDYAGAILKTNITGNAGGSSSSGGGGADFKASDYVYSRPVALTFEFFNPTGGEYEFQYRTDLYGYGVGSYMKSNLYARTKQMTTTLPDDLRDNIRAVKKFVTFGEGTPVYHDVTSLQLFDLSISECSKLSSPVVTRETLIEGVPNTYLFYTNTSDPAYITTNAPNNRWLRSESEDVSIPQAVYAISSNSWRIETHGAYSLLYGYASFCIGRK